jgi:ubiquilin
MENPELMQRMMQSPFMQNMLENPELMRGMLMSNPGYRQVRPRL